MRSEVGYGFAYKESRHCLAEIQHNASHRRYYKNAFSIKENKKFGRYVFPEGFGCRFRLLKLILVFTTCGSFMTLLNSPSISNGEVLMHSGRSRFVHMGWLWGSDQPDSGYTSYLKMDWRKISKAVDKLGIPRENLNVGLLNFNQKEFNQSQTLLHHSTVLNIHLDQSNTTWDELFPEWIDEEEEYSKPTCPKLPQPSAPKGVYFDLVMVKLPCRREGNWSRDVGRLHLQLSAARVAVESLIGGGKKVHVLIISKCFPIPNLFKCKRLVTREGDVWLYKPEMDELIEKLKLPVGSCKLALPYSETERKVVPSTSRLAYATILHSENAFVCGAITVAQSIRMTGSTHDLILLVDESISADHRVGLETAGWKIRTIKRIRNPHAEPEAYNEWNYSKFWLWKLTDYDKVIFIDADLIILRNIDVLFTMPEITATGNNGTLFNSGVMVIEPSDCTFELLMKHINEIESYNGGDQGYLNEIFPWWHRIPMHMNFLKHFWEGDSGKVKEKKTRLFGSDPPIVFLIHYLGIKPWLCYRDYDCNWNVEDQREFASDVAHHTWWRVHDKMPKYLQSFCLLSEKQKETLKSDMVEAKERNYTDGHWKKMIKDPRMRLCSDDICIKNRMKRNKETLRSFVM
ncbi:Hexosyltransferase [Rhynchospora pubera]|uniref:Hexosyltransferase n=1 Tax=Rhynchospora pubera TaxID=906938 RepID=A0AAV8FFS8_9POAL|nr:Hexosyltransferase [Rhynchospora pubera]